MVKLGLEHLVSIKKVVQINAPFVIDDAQGWNAVRRKQYRELPYSVNKMQWRQDEEAVRRDQAQG